METYTVEILNPKALRLLTDLADLNLIAFLPESPAIAQTRTSETDRAEARERIIRDSSQAFDIKEMVAEINAKRAYRTPIVKPKPLSEHQKAEARKAVMRGSLDMDVEAMLEHIRESREDRPLPFRD